MFSDLLTLTIDSTGVRKAKSSSRLLSVDQITGSKLDIRKECCRCMCLQGYHCARRFHQDPSGYAMERYAYYVCFKCNKAYYGGEARCEEGAVGGGAGGGDAYDPSELVCGGCSDVARAQMCPKHGTDFLEYKCRYCCSVAVFFCFGSTHFCNACHDDFQRVTNVARTELPHCPAGACCYRVLLSLFYYLQVSL